MHLVVVLCTVKGKESVPSATRGRTELISQILSRKSLILILISLIWDSSGTFGFFGICTAMFAAAEMFCVVSWSGTEVRICMLLAMAEKLLESAVSTCLGMLFNRKKMRNGKGVTTFIAFSHKIKILQVTAGLNCFSSWQVRIVCKFSPGDDLMDSGSRLGWKGALEVL